MVVRGIWGVIVGIVVAIGLFMAIEGISAILHPYPEGFMGTKVEIAKHVTNYPIWVLTLLGVGYGLTMFVCTFLTTCIGSVKRKLWLGYGVGALIFAMVVINLVILPYPIWYRVFMLTILPVACLGGPKLARCQEGS